MTTRDFQEAINATRDWVNKWIRAAVVGIISVSLSISAVYADLSSRITAAENNITHLSETQTKHEGYDREDMKEIRAQLQKISELLARLEAERAE